MADRFLYGLTNRPVAFAVPKGYTLVERGTAGSYPLRTDLPEGTFRHGVIAYDGQLTDREVEAFELTPVSPPTVASLQAELTATRARLRLALEDLERETIGTETFIDRVFAETTPAPASSRPPQDGAYLIRLTGPDAAQAFAELQANIEYDKLAATVTLDAPPPGNHWD
jgi:hypothetical protein